MDLMINGYKMFKDVKLGDKVQCDIDGDGDYGVVLEKFESVAGFKNKYSKLSFNDEPIDTYNLDCCIGEGCYHDEPLVLVDSFEENEHVGYSVCIYDPQMFFAEE